MTNAIKNSNRETFADFLRRCGGDHEESGASATAEDYYSAAQKIDALTAALAHAETAMAATANGNPVLKHSLVVVRAALKDARS
jgi:hypothetical protein